MRPSPSLAGGLGGIKQAGSNRRDHVARALGITYRFRQLLRAAAMVFQISRQFAVVNLDLVGKSHA